MEQDFKPETQDATAFINKVEGFFKDANNINIICAMYVLGLKMESRHYIKNEKYFSMDMPKRSTFEVTWEIDMFDRVFGGKDEFGGYAEDNDGLPECEYAMRKTIEYGLPIWGIFFNIGRMQGYLNGYRITIDRFNEYYRMIPGNTLSDIASDLKYLFEAFDERNLKVEIVSSLQEKTILVLEAI